MEIKKNITEQDEIDFLKAKNYEKKFQIKKDEKSNYFFYFCLFFQLVLFIISSIIIYLLWRKLHKNNNIKYDDNINNNDYIIKPYLKAQKEFCEKPIRYLNQKYEDEIFLSKVKFNELLFQMYIFKTPNFILNEFNLYGAYEIPLSNNIIEALKFYGSKNNIPDNKNIFMLDIGGNVGWYPSLLGRYGYSILLFEAFEKNYYVAKKNYCFLNKDSNIIIITKGLEATEQKCHYFNQKDNTGNGMVICSNKTNLNDTNLGNLFIKESDVEIITLNSFFPYLSNKNIALMKIDVEGHELNVLEGGKEYITKMHIPFVVLEFSPSYLKEVGSEPKDLAQFFVDNGYKISLDGFLSKNYLNVDELLNKTGFQVNCYFIHESIINLMK